MDVCVLFIHWPKGKVLLSLNKDQQHVHDHTEDYYGPQPEGRCVSVTFSLIGTLFVI